MDWSEANNILCVRLDSLGDVLMSTPAIRALKESKPCRRITLLTSPAGAKVAELVPEIDKIILYDAPWMKATQPRLNSRPEYMMAAELNQAGFDGAVIFTVYSQNPLPAAFLCYLAGIPLRLAHCRENPYQLLTHWAPDVEWEDGARHEVRRQLDLVAAIGSTTRDESLSLVVPAQVRRKIQRSLSQLGIDQDRPWLVIHPGASAPSRRYPEEGFAEATRQLVAEFGIQVLFSGTRLEKDLIRRIQDRIDARTVSLAGELSLAEFAALLSLAPVLISNNTGPVHVAAAVGTPVVDLYALTNPQHTPWMVASRLLYQDVPCKYCYKSFCPEGHHHCLSLVAPEAVVQAACELMCETSRFYVLERLAA
jgi:lipopolysaccharide heptosyltransferase II